MIQNYLTLPSHTKTFLVYGYTPMCGTCKLASRMVDVLPALTGLHVEKINLNYNEPLTMHYKLMSVPVLLVIKDLEVVDIIYRFESVTNLFEIINKSVDVVK